MTDIIVGSGGGGCFPAGVLVKTLDGDVPIELLKVGDKVVSYNQHGILEEDTVVKVHVHPNEEVLTFNLWGGELSATPNHWVLNQYNAFVEIGTITTEDCFVDFMGHLRPLLSSSTHRVETVYNLTVEKNHTFIANGIRVHNGGKGIQKPIIGSGGGGGGKGGGGSARQPIVDPDSLSSKQYARILDLISEGEIEGLAEGHKSIYFDNTPLMASDGTYNFSTTGLALDWRTGTQDQDPMPIFNTQETEISTENREITIPSPATYSITESYVDKVRLNLVVPRLSYTDTATGDVRGASVAYKVSVKQDATNPSSVFVPQILGRKDTFASTSLTPADADHSISYTTVASDNATFNITPALGYDVAHRIYESNETLSTGYKVQYKAPSSSTWIDTTAIGIITINYSFIPATLDPDTNSTLSEARLVVNSTSGTSSVNISFPSYATWDVRIISYQGSWNLNEVILRYVGTYYSHSRWAFLNPPIYRPSFYPYVSGITTSVYNYTETITGKASSPYRTSKEIDLTGMTFPVDIKLTRVTADSASQYLQNSLVLESYTKILTEKLTYPNSALLGIQIDATQFTNIPNRTYDMKLLKVKIPNGYDPLTRTYPTIWDGSMTVAWTDNPAWVFYDLCTNPRYGLGRYIVPAHLDVFQLYSIAKYCDELVADGFGGLEPRYSCNLYLQSREEAYKVLSSLASLFSSIVFWGTGSINILSDMETDTSAVFTNANVEEGIFNYSTSSLKATHTVALVSYIDKTNSYKPAIEYVEDTEGVEKYGIKEIEVIAYGCTSRGQAHRLGRRMLLTEKLEGEMVTFKTGLGAAYCRPGRVIKIVDNTLSAGNLIGGRLLNYTTSSLALDRPITLKNGIAYSISVTLDNNQVRKVDITNPAGETYNGSSATSVLTTVTLKNVSDYFQPITTPVIGGIWAMGSSEATSYSFWRVLGMKETEDLVFEVACMKYEPTKFTQIETGIDLFIKPIPPSMGLEAPSLPETISNPLYTVGGSEPEFIPNINIVESLYRIGKADIATKINVSWQAVVGASEYRIRYKVGTNNWVTRTVNVPYIELENAADGEQYTIEVRVSNIIGRISNALTVEHTVIGKLAPPSNVTGLTITRNLKTASLSWNQVGDLDLAGYEVRYYTGTSAVSWDSATILATNISGTRVDLSFSASATKHNFLVKAIDTTGHYSTTEAGYFVTVDIPTTPNFTSSIVGGSAVLKVTPSAITGTQLPITNYDIVYGSSWESPTGDVSEGLMDSNIVPINYTSRQYWVKTIDMAGNYSASISTTVTVTTLSAVASLASYFKNGKVYLTWVAPTLTGTNVPVSYYKVYRGNAASYNLATFVADVTDENYSQVVDWAIGSSEKFWVVPVDTRGETYLGTPNNLLVATVAPSAVTFSSLAQVGQSLLVDWNDASASMPIKEYEVRLNGTDWSTSTYLGVVNSSSMYIPLSTPGTLTIRIKAIDINNTVGVEAITTYSYTVPAVVQNLASTFVLDQAKLTWTAPASITVPIDKYEIRQGTDTIGFTYGSTFSIRADWSGARSFGVRAIDIAGNVGTEQAISVTVETPTAPTVSLAFVGTDIQIDFTTPSASLPIDKYEIRRGGTAWGVGDTLVDIITNNTLLYTVAYQGIDSMTYRVKAYDIVNAASGSEGTASISVIPPTIPNVSAQAVDNNVLLYWTGTKGSLPIATYEIRRGSTWNSAAVIGDKFGGFTTVFETTGGTYTYWIAAKDTAGNYGTPVSRAVVVTSPPDYIFRYKHDSILNTVGNSYSPDGGTTQINITRNNCAIDPIDGYIIAPINTSETWATHFSTRSWVSLQDQIDAGYSIYAQPSNTTSADYIEEIDYATFIGYMKVSVSYGGDTVAGSVTTGCYISYKVNSGDAWSSEINATEAYLPGFRYVRVRINIAASNQQSLYRLTSLSVKLDAKSKSDGNNLYGIHSDTNGTNVTWGRGITFADISAITTQVKAYNIVGTITGVITGTTCVATCTSHNLVVGDNIYLGFSGGTPPLAGTYVVISKTATTFTFIVASGSGNPTITARIPIYALYDFTDAPNPTGFSVYVYDASGNRASGLVSWSAEGY